MVAYNMSEWRKFVKICKTAPLTDVIILLVTFALTVVFDLVVAIAAGLILTAFIFLKKSADSSQVREWDSRGDDGRKKEIPYGVVVYEINGPMFFAASDKYLNFPIHKDTKVMIVRMSGVPSMDSTAEASIENLCALCESNGVELIFSHVNPQPMELLRKYGIVDETGKDRFCNNIDDAIEMASVLLKAKEEPTDEAE